MIGEQQNSGQFEDGKQAEEFKTIQDNSVPEGLGSEQQTVSIEVRAATLADIPGMVEVDLRGFKSIHKDDPRTEDEIRAGQTAVFTERLERVGGDWIDVLEIDGKIGGFVMGCPTNKPPEDFISWEDTTDNGTLRSAYDPEGRYLYVVSLATIPQASKAGGDDLLMESMIGKIFEGGYLGYFESRMPGFLRWARNKNRSQGLDAHDMPSETVQAYAEEYINHRVTVNGESVLADPLLRMYEGVGAKFVKVCQGAYLDSRSLNCGVVCTIGPEQETADLAGPETTAAESEVTWFGRNKFKLALAVAAGSLALTAATGKFEEIKDNLVEDLPELATGILISEGSIGAGAVLCLAGIGSKVGNPFKARGRMKEILARGSNSKLFRAGFALNRAGAYGTGVILATAVVAETPPTAWGLLSVPLLDIWGTYQIARGVNERRVRAQALIPTTTAIPE